MLSDSITLEGKAAIREYHLLILKKGGEATTETLNLEP